MPGAAASSRTRRRADAGGPGSRALLPARSCLALSVHGVLQRTNRAVIEHLRGVLAAAHQFADLVELETGMPQRDGVALALGQARDVRQQRPVLDPFLGLARGVVLGLGLVRDGPAQLVTPALGAEVVEGRV